MRTEETTNGKLAAVLDEITTLIHWADADADQSAESGARSQAKADRKRATILRLVYADLVLAKRR